MGQLGLGNGGVLPATGDLGRGARPTPSPPRPGTEEFLAGKPIAGKPITGRAQALIDADVRAATEIYERVGPGSGVATGITGVRDPLRAIHWSKAKATTSLDPKVAGGAPGAEGNNGRWDEYSNVYATADAGVMRERFWNMVNSAGKVSVKNKVVSFQGLTVGIPSWVGDRWQFVLSNLPMLQEMRGVSSPQDLFKYSRGVPEDPTSVYGVYGGLEGNHELLSNVLYELQNSTIQSAIDNNPEVFKPLLGDHMNPGGFHWVSWNAIKNEPVGHSSLSLLEETQLSKDAIPAGGWFDFLMTKSTFTEGNYTGGNKARVTFDRGVVTEENNVQ